MVQHQSLWAEFGLQCKAKTQPRKVRCFMASHSESLKHWPQTANIAIFLKAWQVRVWDGETEVKTSSYIALCVLLWNQIPSWKQSLAKVHCGAEEGHGFRYVCTSDWLRIDPEGSWNEQDKRPQREKYADNFVQHGGRKKKNRKAGYLGDRSCWEDEERIKMGRWRQPGFWVVTPVTAMSSPHGLVHRLPTLHVSLEDLRACDNEGDHVRAEENGPGTVSK